MIATNKTGHTSFERISNLEFETAADLQALKMISSDINKR